MSVLARAHRCRVRRGVQPRRQVDRVRCRRSVRQDLGCAERGAALHAHGCDRGGDDAASSARAARCCSPPAERQDDPHVGARCGGREAGQVRDRAHDARSRRALFAGWQAPRLGGGRSDGEDLERGHVGGGAHARATERLAAGARVDAGRPQVGGGAVRRHGVDLRGGDRQACGRSDSASVATRDARSAQRRRVERRPGNLRFECQAVPSRRACCDAPMHPAPFSCARGWQSFAVASCRRSADAQVRPPVIGNAVPYGLQRGTTTTITVDGTNLGDADAVLFSDPGLQRPDRRAIADFGPDVPTRRKEDTGPPISDRAQKSVVTLEVTAAPDVPRAARCSACGRRLGRRRRCRCGSATSLEAAS